MCRSRKTRRNGCLWESTKALQDQESQAVKADVQEEEEIQGPEGESAREEEAPEEDKNFIGIYGLRPERTESILFLDKLIIQK